jgi:TatD DNase family protein
VAKKHDLPLILHTRKAEQRTFEILQEEGASKVDMHCYGGKVKLAKQVRGAR